LGILNLRGCLDQRHETRGGLLDTFCADGDVDDDDDGVVVAAVKVCYLPLGYERHVEPHAVEAAQ
jgi:hypothetical protein